MRGLEARHSAGIIDEPVIVGSDVMPSVLEIPVSLASAAVMTGALVSPPSS